MEQDEVNDGVGVVDAVTLRVTDCVSDGRVLDLVLDGDGSVIEGGAESDTDGVTDCDASCDGVLLAERDRDLEKDTEPVREGDSELRWVLVSTCVNDGDCVRV
jgi:hypothetical protein